MTGQIVYERSRAEFGRISDLGADTSLVAFGEEEVSVANSELRQSVELLLKISERGLLFSNRFDTFISGHQGSAFW